MGQNRENYEYIYIHALATSHVFLFLSSYFDSQQEKITCKYLTNYKFCSAISDRPDAGRSPNTRRYCLLSTVSYPGYIKAYLCLAFIVSKHILFGP